MKELLLFHVGKIQFGVDLHLTSSIEPLKPIVFEQPADSLQMAQGLDDQETRLYDLSELFDQKTLSGDSDNRKMIIVAVEGNPVGLIVDRVDRVISADDSRIEMLPSIFNGPSMLCFPGVLQYEGHLVLVLDPAGIVSVDRHRSKITGTGAGSNDREQTPGASQRLASGDNRELLIPISENSSLMSMAQPLAANLNDKVQKCMQIKI
jgi:chemotaxis signal transduction protein